MSFSQAEILALSTRAARGAGAPPAQAAQFGRACVVHLVWGRRSDDLVAVLEAAPAGAIVDLPAALQVVSAAGGRGDINVDCPTDLLRSYVESLPFAAVCEGRWVTIDPTTPAMKTKATRVDPDAGFIARLEAWAAHTYVPESEASRLGGAGAGLSDND